MKIREKVEQGGKKWLMARWGRVGGTASGGLFVKGDTLLLNILAEATEEFQMDEGFKSKDMERGSELEPLGRERLSDYIGLTLLEYGMLDSSECDLIFISPDGMTSDETVMCEIKCPGAKRHLETCLSGAVPKDNIFQCVHYFTVNPKLEKLHFLSFRPESIVPMKVITLTRASEVNVGTAARPKLEIIGALSERALVFAKDLEIQIKEKIELLKF